MQKRFAYIFSALILLFGLYGVFFAQKIPISDGRGWDGVNYVRFVHTWPQPITEKELPPYYFKKIALPAAVHYTCSIQASIQGIPVSEMSIATVLLYFDLYNLLFFCLIFFLFYKIFIAFLGERFTQQPWWIMVWAGANFCVLKMTFYYPALLDSCACMLGTLLLYGYITKKKIWMLVAMTIGYFVHPFLFIIGAPLMIWPESITYKRTVSSVVVWLVILLFAGLFGLWLYDAYIYFPGWVRPAQEEFIWLSVACTIGYLCYIIYTSGLLRDGLNYLFHIHWVNLITVVLLYAACTVFMELNRNPDPGWSLIDFLHQTGYGSMQSPLIFLVSQVVYFGPGVIVLFLFMSQWKDWLRQQPGGFQLVIWLMLFLMVNDESRQLVVFWPFAALVIVKVVSEWKQTHLHYVMAFFLLAWSRVWLDMHSDTFKNEGYYDFPAQYYFMHHGLWMSVENYYWQAAVCVLMVALLYGYKKALDKNEKTFLPS